MKHCWKSDNDKIVLYCGDCLKIMPHLDMKFDLILTDPPYGVLPNGKENDRFQWDNINLIPFTTEWFSCSKKLMEESYWSFIFWSQKHFNMGIKIFNPTRVLFWRYNNLINNPQNNFCYDYDAIFAIKTGSPKLIPGKHSCDLEFTRPQSNFKKDKLIHPAQKPLDLIKHLLHITSSKTVFDPFMGSGTTGVACIEAGIKFVGIEKEPRYFEMAIDRIKQKGK
jgi:DNA modification methylase